jgi:hypothetical protein
MCTVLLPPGDNPIAVNKYLSYHIWHYNPLWVFTFSANSLQVLLSLAVSFQFLIFIFFKSYITCSCHHSLGLPTGVVPICFQSNSFPIGLARSILFIWPSHLILCALMNLTITAPSVNLSISMLFRILYILSVLTGPDILFNICLSKIRKLREGKSWKKTKGRRTSISVEKLIELTFVTYSTLML